MADDRLLEEICNAGGELLRTSKNQLATIGSISDDERWGAPFPLRFELQFALLSLGALDAYDVATGILRTRASQQAFGSIRFQFETLAQMRWLTESENATERKTRAMRLLCAQIDRWAKFLMKDAGQDPDALEGVRRVRGWGERLRWIAGQDGIVNLRLPPGRPELLARFATRAGGYPTFSMLSELGSHPDAVGNILFSMDIHAQTIAYTLEGAFVDRAFWASAAIFHLWQTIEVMASVFSWEPWLSQDAKTTYTAVIPLMHEALRRRQASNPPLLASKSD